MGDAGGPVYIRRWRQDSLSHAPDTGVQSEYRMAQRERQVALWQRAWDAEASRSGVGPLVKGDIDQRLCDEVGFHAGRLRSTLETSSRPATTPDRHGPDDASRASYGRVPKVGLGQLGHP